MFQTVNAQYISKRATQSMLPTYRFTRIVNRHGLCIYCIVFWSWKTSLIYKYRQLKFDIAIEFWFCLKNRIIEYVQIRTSVKTAIYIVSF